MAEVKKNNVQIIVPRSYQLKLLEYVMKRNAIIYLPTGAGKTFVAILALKRFSHLMHETLDNGGKRAVFMCNTVELARQQAMYIRETTSLKVGFYVGGRAAESWHRRRWSTEINVNQVFVGTAQIFLDMVSQRFLKISDICLVVVDECHHATKNHPMHELLRLFTYSEHTNVPRVIGLTGVLIKNNNKLNAVKQELDNLETIFRGSIVTVGNMEEYTNVLVYSTKPTEQMVSYSSVAYMFPLQKKISQLVDKICTVIDIWDIGSGPPRHLNWAASWSQSNKKTHIKSLLRDFVYQMEDFGLYAASVAIMSPITDMESKLRQAETLELRNLYCTVICACEYIRHIIVTEIKRSYDEICECVGFDPVDVIMKFSSPKLTSLLSYLKQTFSSKQRDDICCLVFVHRRYTAKCLLHVLEKYLQQSPDLQKIISPQFMTGKNSIRAGVEHTLDHKRNRKAMEQLRRKECNLVICSNVLEEGIDIQACNYVLVLDPLMSFSSYLQTKGRARSNNSVYTLFTSELEQHNVEDQVNMFRYMHKTIKSYLADRVLDHAGTKEEHFAPQFVHDSVKPLVLPSGATLLPSSALQLLSRYCHMLDMSIPWFSMASVAPGKCVVSVQLPRQSAVKEVVYGDPMPTTKLAKISASMCACVKLYELGEINDQLLPVANRDCIDNAAEVLFPHWKKHHRDVIVGLRTLGKQYRRNYKIMCPKELYGAKPAICELCYAYKITMTPVFERTDCNSHIFEALQSSGTYAILVRNRLPRLAAMPLFLNQGRIAVKISEEPIECCITNAKQLQLLLDFQQMIFRDLLQLWTDFLAIDSRNKENSYVIVPIRGDWIDWQLVRKFPTLLANRHHSVAQRRPSEAIYRPEDWIGKVVCKSYSISDEERYIVTKVHTKLTTQSQFNESVYESRYKNALNRDVHQDHFFIEVKPLPSRRNFFVNVCGKASELNGNRSAIILKPEACHNFLFPGDMWIKALSLPSILHRVHIMLHAEAVRVRINNFLEVPNKSTYRPKPLTLDTSLSRAAENFGYATEEIEKSKGIFLPSDSKFNVAEDFRKMPKQFLGENAGNYISANSKPIEQKRHIDMLSRSGGGVQVATAEQSDFVAALTTAAANDVFDMERFELLGDSFLKFAVSIYLVNKFPNLHEGILTEAKSKIVSNRNLLYCMLELDLPGRISSSPFKPDCNWLPPCVSLPSNVLDVLRENRPELDKVSLRDLCQLELSEEEIASGKCSEEKLQRWIQSCKANNALPVGDLKAKSNTNANCFLYREIMTDKTVADTLEALLGVCVKNYGIHRAFRMLQFFNIFKDDDVGRPLRHLMDLNLTAPSLRTNISSHEVDGFLVYHEELEESLGYKFRDRAYLLQALTHPSYATNRITGCYQELEFLGDALLEFLVSCYIFEQYEHMTPGMLTDLRSALSNNITLGCVCVRFRFHLFLLADNDVLSDAISTFANFQESGDTRLTDQVRILMEERWHNEKSERGPSHNMSVNIDVPKALGNVVQAIIAAVYLDSRDLRTTWSVIYHLLQPEINDFANHVPVEPVRRLLEHPNAEAKFSESIAGSGTVMVQCSFKGLPDTQKVNGFGPNSKQARKSAAKYALFLLDKNC